MRNSLHGIPCRLARPSSRRVVADVLGRIKQRFPRDFARLLARVRLIRSLSKRKFASGTSGEWLGKTFSALYGDTDFFTLPLEIRLQWDEWAEGTVELPEVGIVSRAELTSVAAHELGHACTLTIDMERRNAPFDDWASEAAADWYAYKWGFGTLIRASQKSRRISHHGAGPGQRIECDGVVWRVSRNHVYHEVGTSDLKEVMRLTAQAFGLGEEGD